MTWIVGMTTPFGYGIGISDIRVTFHDRSERDCLQKIYRVGNFISAGFSGSVAIGFKMIEKLTELLACEDPTGAWDPTAIAEWWPQDAKEVFDSSPQAECALGCQLLLISAHPTEARIYIHKYCYPDFLPAVIVPPEVAAIGSGTAFEPCRAAVASISNDHEARFKLMKAEQGCLGGMATLLGFNLTRLLQKKQPPGVSSYLHCCWVYRGRVVIAPMNYSTVGPWMTLPMGVDAAEKAIHERDGSTPTSPGMELFKMPPVATSLKELQQLLNLSGVALAQAVT